MPFISLSLLADWLIHMYISIDFFLLLTVSLLFVCKIHVYDKYLYFVVIIKLREAIA